MHDWNHVMVRYCDGGSFSGTSKHVMEADDDLSKEPQVLHMQGRFVLKVWAAETPLRLRFPPGDRISFFAMIIPFLITLTCASWQNYAFVRAAVKNSFYSLRRKVGS